MVFLIYVIDPSVSLNKQCQEFQSPKQTGPEAAFLIGLRRKSGLKNFLRSVASVSHFDNKKNSDAQDHRLCSSANFWDKAGSWSR